MVKRAGENAKIGFPVPLICYVIRLDISWLTMDKTPGPSNIIWATRISSTRSGIQNYHPQGLRISGRISAGDCSTTDIKSDGVCGDKESVVCLKRTLRWMRDERLQLHVMASICLLFISFTRIIHVLSKFFS